MKIKELKDKQKKVNIELKIIYDKIPPEDKFGHKIKTVIAVDADSEQGGESIMLDLYDNDTDQFKFGDKLRVTDGYAKQSQNKRKQFRIVSGFDKDGKPIAKYEKLE